MSFLGAAVGAATGILGSVFGKNGPSRQELQLEGQQSDFYSLMNSYVQQQYGKQQGLLNELTNLYSPIAVAGPGKTGMTEAELNARNTAAIDTTAGNYAAAARSVGSRLARFGTAAGPSGVQEQIEGSIASRAAGQAAAEENQIQQENYMLGRANWEQAMAGLDNVARTYNPEAYGALGIKAGEAAYGSASDINQEQNQASADLWSSIGGLATDLTNMGILGWNSSPPSKGSTSTGSNG